MKEETYNQVREKYPEEFEGKQWALIADDDSLAIKAAAFNLKRVQDLYTGRAEDSFREQHSRDEFIAAGYNAEGHFNKTYLKQGYFGNSAIDYIDRFDVSLKIASDMIDGAYTCK